jgi:hypothetical protein
MARFLAELYLSHPDSTELCAAAGRARTAADQLNSEGVRIRYLRALFLGEDETCFHLYDASTPEAVFEASRRAAIPVERVVEVRDIELGQLKEG